MWVQMLEGISGGRAGGGPWPPRNGLLEVSDEEGNELIQKQLARFYGQSESPAQAAPSPKEKPDVTASAANGAVMEEEAKAASDPEDEVPEPAPTDLKSAWVDYAVSLGANRDEAEGLTKNQLQSAYGGRLLS